MNFLDNIHPKYKQMWYLSIYIKHMYVEAKEIVISGCDKRLTGDVLSWDEVDWETVGSKNDTHMEVNISNMMPIL